MSTIRRIASLKTPAEFHEYARSVGAAIPIEEHLLAAADSPLARPIAVHGQTIGNRFSILPMEGWDGTHDGRPSELTQRRWKRFGASGAKLIWGGEAVAVRHDGRANPNQLLINESNLSGLDQLREILVAEHRAHFGRVDDLLVGLQITHSGRFARPNQKTRLEPAVLYHHPILDRKFGLTAETPVLSDDEIARLVDDFVQAAVLARRAGFAFVDI
jgi:2,4-dienoyl-CoA reductase-like NADH-dependent reductase (Old Yellow Enzyme family)